MNVEKITWYVARSGGIVAWSLLALSLLLGLVLSSRILGRKVSPAWTLSVHRFLGGLGVAFTLIHVAAIMLDDFVDFGFSDVLVPWASEWRPGAVAWGIVAMYLMVAVEATSLAMRWLPKKLWRGVHWTSGPLFIFATLHGYQSGSDAGRAFIIAIVAVMAVLAALTAVRVVSARRASRSPTRPPRIARSGERSQEDARRTSIAPARHADSRHPASDSGRTLR